MKAEQSMKNPRINVWLEATIVVSFEDDKDSNKRHLGRKVIQIPYTPSANIPLEVGKVAHEMLAKLYGKYGAKSK